MSDAVSTNDMNRFRKNLSAAKLRTFPKLPTTVLKLHKCVRTYSRIGSRYVHTTGIGSEPIRPPSNERWEPKQTNGSRCGYFRSDTRSSWVQVVGCDFKYNSAVVIGLNYYKSYWSQ